MNSFGDKCLDRMKVQSKALGRKLTAIEVVACINAQADEVGLRRKRKAPGAPPAPRPRNELFDALARVMGVKDLKDITRAARKSIGVALFDIKQVCPDLTVDELERRAEAYKRRWPDRRNWSAPALAKHWGEFGGDPTRTGIAVMPEPAGDWRAAALIACEKTIEPRIRDSRREGILDGYEWHQIGPEFRVLIIEQMKVGKS